MAVRFHAARRVDQSVINVVEWIVELVESDEFIVLPIYPGNYGMLRRLIVVLLPRTKVSVCR